MAKVSELISVAAAEIGVTEYPSGTNKVKYNTWYYGREVSGSLYPWCMVFVEWCYNEAGIPLPYKTASCSSLLTWYKKNLPGRVVTEPQAGDIIIYTFGHAGILESSADESVTAIEGNTSQTSDDNGGAVMRRTRSMDVVKAYIRPYDFEEEEMSGEEIYNALCEYLTELSAPDWAEEELQEAIELGITDGTRPMELVPRYQAAIMAKRAYKLAKGEA